jgi:hypothetical protein
MRKQRNLPDCLKSITDCKMIHWSSERPSVLMMRSKQNPDPIVFLKGGLSPPFNPPSVKMPESKIVGGNSSSSVEGGKGGTPVPPKWLGWVTDDGPKSKAKQIDKLKALLDEVTNQNDFTFARDKTYPFTGLGKMGYVCRSPPKLLEIGVALAETGSTDVLSQLIAKGAKGAKAESKSGASLATSVAATKGKPAAVKFVAADTCGSPGGFSELLFSLVEAATDAYDGAVIYGITLIGGQGIGDWMIPKHRWGKDFFPYYGGVPPPCPPADECRVGGEGGSVTPLPGDVTRGEVLSGFVDLLKKGDPSHRPLLIVADGGFGVQGDEVNQEIRHILLILSELLIGVLGIQPHKDNLVLCKVFDQRTFLSCYITFLVAQLAEKFASHKPKLSRPASSERYLLFTGVAAPVSNDSVEGTEGMMQSHALRWLLALYSTLGRMAAIKSVSSDKLVASDIDCVMATLSGVPMPAEISPSTVYGWMLESKVGSTAAALSPSRLLWNGIVEAQCKSEDLQLGSLMEIHEVLALMDTFAPEHFLSLTSRQQLKSYWLVTDDDDDDRHQLILKDAETMCREKRASLTNGDKVRC